MEVSDRFLLLLVCLSLCILKGTDGSDCTYAASVRGFGSTYYTALLIGNDPDTIHGINLRSQKASPIIYNTNLRIYKETWIVNAKSLANTVVNAVTLVSTFKLTDYLLNTGLAIGNFLLKYGILNCDNSIDLALSFAASTQETLDRLDGTQLESYVEAVVRGIGYFIDDQGFDLFNNQEYWQELVNDFYHEYELLKARLPRIS